jgi:hypothetical protein
VVARSSKVLASCRGAISSDYVHALLDQLLQRFSVEGELTAQRAH